MRVLHLTKHNVTRYGVAEVMQNLTRALREQGVESWVYSEAAAPGETILPQGTPCVGGRLPRAAWFGFAADQRRLESFCREKQIDLIHAHGAFRPGWAAWLVFRRLGVPYLITSHSDVNPEVYPKIRRWRVRVRAAAALRGARAVTSLNEPMERFTCQIADIRSKCTRIPNGINWSWWQPPEAPPEGSSSATPPAPPVPYVLGAGRLAVEKGFGTLVEAAGLLRARGTPIRLVLAGEGPLRPELETRARALGLDLSTCLADLPAMAEGGLCLPGFVSGDAKRELFAGAALVAFPSQCQEAFGLVMVEAMAAGRALVASDTEAVRGVLQPGRHADLVPAGDASAWANALAALLADAPRAAAYGHQNRADSRQYDWAAVAAAYRQVYDRCLQR